MDWTTIPDLAARLGVSRRTVDRALAGDGIVGEHQLEARPATPEDGQHPSCRTVARVVPAAPFDPERAVADALSGMGSPEETIRRLERIFRGEETRRYYTSAGELAETEFSDMAQIRAGEQAQKLREFLDERNRAYIPRDLVADALVSLAGLLANRLAAVPSRLADRVVGAVSVADARERLGVAIDEIRTELGDAAERHLEQLL